MLGALWGKCEQQVFLFFSKSPRCPSNPDIPLQPLESRHQEQKQPKQSVEGQEVEYGIETNLSTFRPKTEQSLGGGQSIEWELSGKEMGMVG